MSSGLEYYRIHDREHASDDLEGMNTWMNDVSSITWICSGRR